MSASETTIASVIVPLEQSLDLLALHRMNPQRYPFLLQSVSSGPQSRFDILFACPQSELVLQADGQVVHDGEACKSPGFLNQLDGWFAREASPVSSAMPFSGGWFLYLGYELAGEIEPVLRLPLSGLPSAYAVRIPAALIRDCVTGRNCLVIEDGFSHLQDEIIRDIENCDIKETASVTIAALIEDPEQRYLESVERIKRYIHDGDVFQVNLSRRWQGDYTGCPVDLYQSLCRANPAPFAALAQYADMAIVSSSPERLIEVRDGLVQTRPIAGTHPRGETPEQDQALQQALLQHPKEQAEHVMLIDLERNDLGRVCIPGSVHVNELMVLESYAHVHHIVSNVCGRLRNGVTPGEVIAAVFPGGTITGCPKVRCMQIIAELEQCARGAYTGSLGYLNRDGSMDLNILIRTLTLRNGTLSLRTGAGIVADSVAEKELQETRHKAKGLLRALGGT